MQVTRDIEKYAKDYLQDNFEFIMSKYRKEMLARLLHNYQPKHIVDIGPAYNYVFDVYKNFESYTIVEPSKTMCARIRPQKGVTVLNDFFETAAAQIKQPVDFIIASGLIHEVTDPEVFLHHIRSLCGPETILHISAPNNTSFHLVYAQQAGIIKQLGNVSDYSQKMQRLRTYNMQSLEQLVQKAGFNVIEKGPFFFKFFNQAKMEKCVKDGLLTDDLLKALNDMARLLPEYAAEIWLNAKIK